MLEQLAPVEHVAEHSLVFLLTRPAKVQGVQANISHIEDEEVRVVADDWAVVGDGHLGDDMVCFIGTLDNLKKDFV